MARHICFLLAPSLAFFVGLPPYAQHMSGGGHFSAGGLSGHSVGRGIAQSFGHMFGRHSSRGSSPFQKGSGRSRGELPPLAGAALIRGKVVTLPGPESGMTLGQPPRTVRGRFAVAFAPHRPFAGDLFEVGFCDSFRFTWHSFLSPDEFDCFGKPLFSHRSFSLGLRGHFWSDSMASPMASGSAAFAAQSAPSAPPRGVESSAPSSSKAGQPVTLLQLRDGSMYGLVRYWVDGGRLHYVTDYGGEGNVPLERIDLEKTGELNASRGTPLVLQNANP